MNNQHCHTTCPPIIKVVGSPGPQGLQGATGPQGPQGPQGRSIFPFTNSFLSLQEYNVANTLPSGLPNYHPQEYSFIGAQNGTTIIPPTIPGNGPVTLRGGYSYSITYTCMGNAQVNNPPTKSIRLNLNGNPVPIASDEWASITGAMVHSWIFSPTQDTTLQYEVGGVNIASVILRGAYLNIFQLA